MRSRVVLHKVDSGTLREAAERIARAADNIDHEDVMRQNVYLIEFLRELFDPEPRLAWYTRLWLWLKKDFWV